MLCPVIITVRFAALEMIFVFLALAVSAAFASDACKKDASLHDVCKPQWDAWRAAIDACYEGDESTWGKDTKKIDAYCRATTDIITCWDKETQSCKGGDQRKAMKGGYLVEFIAPDPDSINPVIESGKVASCKAMKMAYNRRFSDV